MKNYTAFFLAALMIPATALYAQGRGGRPAGGGRPGGQPGGGTVSRQPGGRPGGAMPSQPGARPDGGRPGGAVPGERRLGGAVVIPGRPDPRPVIPIDPLPPAPPAPGGGPVVVSPDFFDPLLPGYGT